MEFGILLSGVSAIIVDPVSKGRCKDSNLGEIWVECTKLNTMLNSFLQRQFSIVVSTCLLDLTEHYDTQRKKKKKRKREKSK